MGSLTLVGVEQFTGITAMARQTTTMVAEFMAGDGSDWNKPAVAREDAGKCRVLTGV